MRWINKDTEIYCSFAKQAGNTGCQLMNSMFYYYNLNKIYKSFSVNNIEDAIMAVKILNIKGFAVTMPFKKEVIKYIDNVSDIIKEIGSVNTVLNDNGILTAFNTDYLAAIEILKNKSRDKKVYVLGDGGYAQSVKYALKILNFQYEVINRINWNNIFNIKNSIIYNCTPVDNIKIEESNEYIDCLVTTKTGKKLATIQASFQFKIYTGLDFFNIE